MNLLEETVRDFYENCVENEQSEYAVPRILHSLVIAQRPKVAVEIGSNMGYCSMAIASALRFLEGYDPSEYLKKWKAEYHAEKRYEKVKGKLYCIDPVLQPDFERRLKKFGFEDLIEFIAKRSDDVDPRSLPPIDFLFIDGDHSYKGARNDFANFFPRVTAGGYVAIHDYFPDSPSKEMLWWGPNILAKQLRRDFDFGDSFVVDTAFSSLALFRKRKDYLDSDLLDSNLVKSFLQFYLRKYRIKCRKILSKLKNGSLPRKNVRSG